MSPLRDTLNEISTILCTIYYPSHACMYILIVMGVERVRVPKKLRTPMDNSKRRRLNRLLNEIMQMDLGDQPYYIYDLHERVQRVM